MEILELPRYSRLAIGTIRRAAWLSCSLMIGVIGGAYSQPILAAFNPSSVAITGGAIDGVTIGGTTPASGTFTTLTATGATTFANQQNLNFKDSGGTARLAFFSDSSSNLLFRPLISTSAIDMQNSAGTTLASISGNGTGNGGLAVGSAVLTMKQGELGFSKITASGAAAGAAGGKIELVCGTTAGTAKIIAYAGTSTTPSTILDNIGTGVTGC